MRIQEINCEQSLQAIISLSIMKSKILPNCLKGKYEYHLENLEFNISNTLFIWCLGQKGLNLMLKDQCCFMGHGL